jgi:tripartite-type tricarboxylate transporter receptor subunit TctC
MKSGFDNRAARSPVLRFLKCGLPPFNSVIFLAALGGSLFFFFSSALTGNHARAAAEEFPDKPIRIVVPYPPGGFNDTLARTLSEKLHASWGQTVIVDNRPGGGTTIGANIVARAPADGHTLLIVSFAFAVNPSLYASLPTTRCAISRPWCWRPARPTSWW